MTQEFEHRLCVPNVGTLRRDIMEEGHGAAYAIHSGATKMYQDLRQILLVERDEMGCADYVSCCLTYQQVKAVHQRPGGLL